MNQWIALGIFLLGAGLGALLTWIARCGLKSRQNNSSQIGSSSR
jgi:hypothetical protein